jgi:hypothetical protein
MGWGLSLSGQITVSGGAEQATHLGEGSRMKLLSASLCALALAGFLARAGLSQDGTKDKSYYPLRVGLQWTYAAADGPKTVVRVTKEEKIGDVPCARVEKLVNGKAVSHEHLAAQKDGVYRYAGDGKKVEPPLLILKLPPTKGASWKVDSKFAGFTFRGAFTLDEADVTVPAGKYPTVSVRTDDLKVNDTPVSMTQWFAPGVGLVKQVVNFGDKKLTLGLEKFEAGK